MRYESDRHRAARLAARDVRIALIAEAGQCMACGKFALAVLTYDSGQLACHEILGGGLREKTLAEPCALLVLCWDCNSEKFTDRRLWPIARQLALLKAWFPHHYDLTRFNWLRNPNAPNFITQKQVDEYRDEFRHFEEPPGRLSDAGRNRKGSAR